MAKVIGRGCRDCNMDILVAEVTGPYKPGYCGTDEFRRIATVRPTVYLDGDDQTGLEVYALVVGGQGWVLRNHLKRFPNGRSHYLCECGSQYVKVELLEGHVQLVDQFRQAVIL